MFRRYTANLQNTHAKVWHLWSAASANISIRRNWKAHKERLSLCIWLDRQGIPLKFRWLFSQVNLHWSYILGYVGSYCSFSVGREKLLYIFRNSPSEVFLEKGVLKMCSKCTGEHLCQSVISKKLQSYVIEIRLGHGCINVLHIFETPFS